MPEVSNSRIVAFSAERIFKTIMDIETYPQILHFIRDIKILERGNDYITAQVSVGLPALAFSYDCRIEYEENRLIKVRLISGPFKRMNALWTLDPQGSDKTNVTYALDAEFNNPFMEMTAGVLFASQIHYSIRAFEERLKRS